MPHMSSIDPFTGAAGLAALAATLGVSVLVLSLIIAIVALWTLVAKGLALWHAARNSQNVWFIAMLVLNTFGILEIIYLLFFRTPKEVEIEKVAETEKVV